MRFLLDAQLPPSLAIHFREQGLDAMALREVGLRDAADHEIWDWALAHQAVIVTKDDDFIKLLLARGAPPQVMWLRIGNATNAALLKWLMPVLPAVLNSLGSGDPLVEIL